AEFVGARGERRGDRRQRLVDGLSGGLLLVGGGERAELALEPGEPALLAEQIGVEAAQLVERVGGGDVGQCCVARGTDVVDHGSPFRNERWWTAPRVDSGRAR